MRCFEGGMVKQMIGYLILGGIAGTLALLTWLGREPRNQQGSSKAGLSHAGTRHKSLSSAMPRRRPVQQFPTRRPWTREEDLAVFHLQRLKTEGRLTSTDIEDLAAGMNRTEAAIVMRIGNFDALDPSVPSKGLSNAAQLTREIWSEYRCDPEQICADAFSLDYA